MAQPAMAQPAYPLHSGPFTREDRDAMPEDGRRVELIDGALIVSPSAGLAHNLYVMHVFRLLEPSCPADVTIFPLAYDFAMPEGSTVVPDITVARTEDLGEKELTKIPLLVVEVISPSSRLTDPLVKRAKYEEAGVPAYWIVEPIEPSLTVLELVHDSYVTRHVLRGIAYEVTVTRPYPVTLHLRLR